MTAHRLLLTASEHALNNLTRDDFLWRVPPALSSMHVSLGPRAEELGPVPELNADLLRLATLVYLVDRTVPRGRGIRKGLWLARDFTLTVPVSDPAVWSMHEESLAALLGFLTGDEWRLVFERRRLPRRRRSERPVEGGPVVLFSGGADSLAGALLLHDTLGRAPVLVSHWSWSVAAGIQNELVSEMRQLWSNPDVIHEQLHIGRRAHQIGSGLKFRSEDSSRSRAVLFMALGLAVAAVRNSELTIAENGFTSLNIPLSGDRRGVLSTRTTHPSFLDGLTEMLNAVGLDVQLQTPYQDLTKGEIFGRVRDVLGAQTATALLSKSHSCAKPTAQYLGPGFSPADQCGLCYGCLVRRAAFLAAGLEDRTSYVLDRLIGDPRRAGWLTDEMRSHYLAVQSFIGRELTLADVLSLGLPRRIDKRAALQLARRGQNELGLLDLDIT